MGETDRTQELSALVELYRELMNAGITNITLSDARPAVSVRLPPASPAVRIDIDLTAGVFVWRRDDRQRHPIDDPAGAATRPAKFFAARETDDRTRR